MKKINIGIVAHVDAGKTTLSEALLYTCGKLNKIGRVDHGDAFLDYDLIERQRGITVYSKQANLLYKDLKMTLVDTPGHIDFSCEMERALQVLDYAVLVISGVDGIQSHTKTVWKLLQTYQIPTFVFVNKMDISHHNPQSLIAALETQLQSTFIDCTNFNTDQIEKIALSSDDLLNHYMEFGDITNTQIATCIQNLAIIPTYFGSALKLAQVKQFLEALYQYTTNRKYIDDFGAFVYKITFDKMNHKLTHVLITGGSIQVKDKISDTQKIDQIRIYSGESFETVEGVSCGDICTFKGLTDVQVGDVFGHQTKSKSCLVAPYMEYQVKLINGQDLYTLYQNLLALQIQEPSLQVRYEESRKEVFVQVMGEIQLEILGYLIEQKYQQQVEFIIGHVLYKETISKQVVGVGHFEPLRHYAEVHLLMEPGDEGSGIVVDSTCPYDVLSKGHQSNILDIIKSNKIPGILTRSKLTDIHFTLIAGRAHDKHTEGGDFKEATIRAIRQGLQQANSVLLEPFVEVHVEVPIEYLSKVIYDMEQKEGTYSIEDSVNTSIMHAFAPASTMGNYQKNIHLLTKGNARVTMDLKGYQPALHQSSIIEQINYDSLQDIDYPCHSIFCKNGAGYKVDYQEASKHMHIKPMVLTKPTVQNQSTSYKSTKYGDDLLQEIFEKTYGKQETQLFKPRVKQIEKEVEFIAKNECIFVDGYNIIHAWPQVGHLVHHDLAIAREHLQNLLCDYQGFKKNKIILVFDGYKVAGNTGTKENYGTIEIVYTKEGQTADMYIEQSIEEYVKDYRVRVASSDAIIQTIILAKGATRMSARELLSDYEYLKKEQLASYDYKSKFNQN